MEGRYIFMGVIIWNAVFVNLISTGHQDVMKCLLQCLFKCTSFIIINRTFQKLIFLYSYDFLHIMGKKICWGWGNMQQKNYKKSNVQLVDRILKHSKDPFKRSEHTRALSLHIRNLCVIAYAQRAHNVTYSYWLFGVKLMRIRSIENLAHGDL